MLTLASRFLFDAVAGALLTAVAATAGATIVFLMARCLASPNALERLGSPSAHLARALRQDDFAYLLVVRLVPLFPVFLVHPVPAAVGFSLRTYAVATFIGILPRTAVFSLVGAGIGASWMSGRARSRGDPVARDPGRARQAGRTVTRRTPAPATARGARRRLMP
jgi:uncharacterized membrane protein YdjX (TVP38/TMEM64 family)